MIVIITYTVLQIYTHRGCLKFIPFWLKLLVLQTKKFIFSSFPDSPEAAFIVDEKNISENICCVSL